HRRVVVDAADPARGRACSRDRAPGRAGTRHDAERLRLRARRARAVHPVDHAAGVADTVTAAGETHTATATGEEDGTAAEATQAAQAAEAAEGVAAPATREG